MPKAVDLTGQKKGHLTAIRRVGNNKDNRGRWLCQCDCGAIKEINVSNFGRTLSCGCVRIGNGLLIEDREIASIRKIYSNYGTNARRRNLDFSLTEKNFRSLITQKCHYCKSIPQNVYTDKHSGKTFLYQGIDRKDNAFGYVDGNVIPCCIVCNRAKNSMGYGKFTEWLRSIGKIWH